MKAKITETKRILEMIAKQYRDPIIYTGFGKDSICLVHLCKAMGLPWEIMFHRDPYFPIKYRYANYIIQQWNLVCRDYPAHSCSVFYVNNTFEVVRHYQAGMEDLLLCALLYKPEEFVEGEYLCALKDIYLQPKGHGVYIWDIGVQGHKAIECKPHSGMKPNMMRWSIKHSVNGPDWAQPLREWTEEDVYTYITKNDIPINTDVYDIDVAGGKLVPKADSTYNPDRRPACFNCMCPDAEMTVWCPKAGMPTNNISRSLVRTIMPNDCPRWDDMTKEQQKIHDPVRCKEEVT